MENRLAKVIRHPLYWELVRGRRSSKGNRWLSTLWPTPSEIRMTFRPTLAYLVNIGPGDTAGNHFHRKRKSFLCAMGPLQLSLYDRRRKKTVRVDMDLGTRQVHRMYYLAPDVPRAIHNPTKRFVQLVLLTNVEASDQDTIPFHLR